MELVALLLTGLAWLVSELASLSVLSVYNPGGLIRPFLDAYSAILNEILFT